MEVFQDIYREIQLHIRESHKKRDQLLAFYITLLAATFAFDRIGIHMREAAGFLVLFGLAVLWALIQYRKWHIRYNGSLVVYQRLVQENRSVTIAELASLWKTLNDERDWWSLLNPKDGIENATMLVACLAVGVPLFLLLQATGWGWSAPMDVREMAVLVDGLIVWVAVNGIIACQAESFQAFPENDWVVRWLRPHSWDKPTTAPESDGAPREGVT